MSGFFTITWEDEAIKLVDQTELPLRYTVIECRKLEDIWEAIKMLKVRGAPALGVAAAWAAYLGVKDFASANPAAFKEELKKVADYIATSRPTAVNLFWGLDRIKKVVKENEDKSVAELKKLIFEEAREIEAEDKRLCEAIGENGESLIKDGDGVLTHCNAGALATAGLGTALAVLYVAKKKGRKFSAFADETRPLLQGARLTTWELMRDGIDVTLLCDNMAGTLMKEGKITKVIVGADRIAKNGDVANKIGTYSVAVLANYHGIPFYVAAPYSTLDLTLENGKEIPIEERDKREVTEGLGRKIAPPDVKVFNPAFDVTPNKLVTAIVTERGIIYPPFEKKLGDPRRSDALT